MNLPLLAELCEAPGPPGREDRVRDVVLRELGPLSDDVEVDPVGNVLARLPGRAAGPRRIPTPGRGDKLSQHTSL